MQLVTKVALGLAVAAATVSMAVVLGGEAQAQGTPGGFSFVEDDFSVAEDAGSVTVSIQRTGGSDGPFTVVVGDASSEATPDATRVDDFSYSPTEFGYADGDAATRTVTVTIVDDGQPERDEKIVLEIDVFDGETVDRAVDTITITIIDDDPLPVCVYKFYDTVLEQAIASYDESVPVGDFSAVLTPFPGGFDDAASTPTTQVFDVTQSNEVCAADISPPGGAGTGIDGYASFEIDFGGPDFAISEQTDSTIANFRGFMNSGGYTCEADLGEVTQPVGVIDTEAGRFELSFDDESDSPIPPFTQRLLCRVTNFSVPICLAKSYSAGAQAALYPELGFGNGVEPTVTLDGTPLTVHQIDPEANPCSTDADPAPDRVAFVTTDPGTIEVSETIDPANAPLTTTDVTCTYNTELSPTQARGTSSASFDPEGRLLVTGNIECQITNSVVAVCVTKTVGTTASDLGLIDADFEFSLDGGTPESVGPSCNPDRAAVLFQVGPGASATISEGLSMPLRDGVDPVAAEAVAATEITCVDSQGDGEPTIGTADLATGSITIDTSSTGELINCEFKNDVLTLCVVKQYEGPEGDEDDDGPQPPELSPQGFEFDVTVNDADPVVLTTVDDDPVCGSSEDAAEAQAGIFVPPGASVQVTERSNVQASVLSGSCNSGEVVEGLVGDTVSITAPPGASDINCFFENASALVCVQKTFGDDALAAGFGLNEGFSFDIVAGDDDEVILEDRQAVLLPQLCDADGAAGVSFLLGADTPFTITENVDEFNRPIAPTDFRCTAGGGDSQVQIETTLDGFTMTASTVAGSTFARVDCQVENDLRLVCVTKQVGAGAVEAGFVAADFQIDVTYDGLDAKPARGESDPCEGPQDDAAVQVSSFVVQAGADAITISETNLSDDPLPVALQSIECELGNEVPVDVEHPAESITFADQGDTISCTLTNDTLIVCVVKEVNPAALDAGYTADLASFTVVDGNTTVEPFDTGCDGEESDAEASHAYALTPEDAGTFTVIEDANALDGRVGPVAARCFPGEGTSSSDLEARTLTSPKSAGEGGVLRCEFVNDSVEVSLTKELVLDDGREAAVSDFLFDVFDGDGAALESGLATGATFFVAPGSTFTISERAADGFTTSASCVDRDPRALQALQVNGSVTHTPGEFVEGVDCTFVNDDLAPIPVCASLNLDEGDSGFTLDDFTLELYLDGALVGERNAGDPFEAECDDISDTGAAVLPGALVKLADVFPDGSTYAFTASVSDPDGRIVFGDSSCSVEPAASTQALKSAAPVSFTVEPGATRVSCFASAQGALAPTPTPTPTEPPLVTGGEPLTPITRPVFVEPVVPAAVAPPVEPLPQVVAVDAIALTGSSTSGVTLPVAFALLSVGFVGLGLGHRRRRRLLGLD